MALYHPPGNDEETHVIAPLDDGSVCIWDISAKSKSKGRIIGRSRAGVLSVEGDGQRSKMVSTGVTECISVDSTQNKLYVAVQSSKCCHSTKSWTAFRSIYSLSAFPCAVPWDV